MKAAVCLTLSTDVQQAVDGLAVRESRSRSWIVDQILREGLAARAALPTAPPMPANP